MATKLGPSNYQIALQEYENKKKDLLKIYRDILRENAVGVSLKKDTSNLFRASKKEKQRLDVRKFNKVLLVDPVNLVAEIEGMTPYDAIVEETLKYGCLPTVIPELKSITIGGALSGGGIEASSFRYGLVHETILEYEILLGDGRVVVCTPDNENKDLYYGFPNTYGSLGYALKVKVKLIPVKPFVKLHHLHYKDVKRYFEDIKKYCAENRQDETDPSFSRFGNHEKNKEINSKAAYIEGVAFKEDDYYITLSEFVDDAPFVSNYKYLNIYFKSIQKKKIDYLKTKDFIWRWDSDWFWCSKFFFMQNFFMRLFCGKWMLNSRSYWKIRNLVNRSKMFTNIWNWFKGPTETVIQDVEIPIQNAENFLKFFLLEIGIRPVWLCPTKPYKHHYYTFYRMDPDTLFINFGFWDVVHSHHEEGYFNRKIEKKVQELGGNKSLYSNVYYTEPEFWAIFDHKKYLTLKEKYDPENKLKDVYTKCRKGS